MILPLSLKIIGAAGVLLVILLIFWKKNRKYIWPFLVVAAGLGFWQGLKEYNRTNKDPETASAKYEVLVNDLLNEFETGDSAITNKKYDDQIIAVNGIVKEIKKDSTNFSIILGDTSNTSTVQCEMKLSQIENAANLDKGSSAKIKGHFVGFRKGEEMMGISLGSTINLNRCVLIKNDK
jgi:hypothetical protein